MTDCATARHVVRPRRPGCQWYGHEQAHTPRHRDCSAPKLFITTISPHGQSTHVPPWTTSCTHNDTTSHVLHVLYSQPHCNRALAASSSLRLASSTVKHTPSALNRATAFSRAALSSSSNRRVPECHVRTPLSADSFSCTPSHPSSPTRDSNTPYHESSCMFRYSTTHGSSRAMCPSAHSANITTHVSSCSAREACAGSSPGQNFT